MDGREEDAQHEGVPQRAEGTQGEGSQAVQTDRGLQEHGKAHQIVKTK